MRVLLLALVLGLAGSAAALPPTASCDPPFVAFPPGFVVLGPCVAFGCIEEPGLLRACAVAVCAAFAAAPSGVPPQGAVLAQCTAHASCAAEVAGQAVLCREPPPFGVP
jgi:hypothetical protein